MPSRRSFRSILAARAVGNAARYVLARPALLGEPPASGDTDEPPSAGLTIIQFADSPGSAVVLGAKPMAGNVLLALAGSASDAAADGWERVQLNADGTGNSLRPCLFYKTAGADEPVTQTPMAGSGAVNTGIWEISGLPDNFAEIMVEEGRSFTTNNWADSDKSIISDYNCMAVAILCTRVSGDGPAPVPEPSVPFVKDGGRVGSDGRFSAVHGHNDFIPAGETYTLDCELDETVAYAGWFTVLLTRGDSS